MSTQTFITLYKRLNTRQKEAVDAIDGPVMVIAGPGTGKTQILTLRIANILRKTDTAPDSILALTFTESGVFSMRKRLVEIIGSAGYRVHIYTFHGFCNEIIKQYPDTFPRIIGASHINDIDKISILKEIISNSNLKYLRPFGDNFFYVNPLRNKISELKRESILPSDLKQIIKEQKEEYKEIEDLKYTDGQYKGKIKGKYQDLEKRIEKNTELLSIYEAYEKMLNEKNVYDYEDMIIETISAFEHNEGLLLKLQEEYQYILADEHQDANNSQNKLLELLASFHKNPNIFIVGDEKQAIFRFQGASLDNFLYFRDRYPKVLLVTLKENYRSTQEILDSTHSLITKDTTTDPTLRTNLISQHIGKGEYIHTYSFSKADFEHLFLAHDIEKKIGEGVLAQEIVVLYRNNRDAEAIVHILEKTNIPFVIESDQNILNDIDIRKLLIIFEAIHGFGNDSKLIPLLHIDFLNIDNLDIYRLLKYAQKEKKSLYTVLKSEKELKRTGIEHRKELHALYERLSSLEKLSHNMNILDFIDRVIQDFGFLSHILQSEYAVEKLEKLNGLVDDVRALVENHREYTFEDLILYFRQLEEHNILIRKDSKSIVPHSVRLMTAHKSKGLEFDYVYVVGVHDGHWGNQKTIEHFRIPVSKLKQLEFDHESTEKKHSNYLAGKIDDERRLFYVALTRARIGATVLYSRESSEGRLQLPSQFIEEIDKQYIENIDTLNFEKKVDKTLLRKPGKRVATPPLKDKKFLNNLFLEQGLSITALNNYLSCPWSYFYSNLLRIPKVQHKHLMFGTAIHHVLKDFFDALKGGDDMGKKKLLLVFEKHLEKQPFSTNDYKEALEKGKTALLGYYDTYISSWEQNIFNEYRVNVLLPLELPGVDRIRLRGDLDKVEFLSNKDINVVDYKTGKPKTRNHIEGKTKSSNGNYKRQLIFYKLLLDLNEDGKHVGQQDGFSMVSGEIDFVEPDDKGHYHKERFEITGGEVIELKKLIEKTAKEVLGLTFWDSRCDDKKCEYCELREKMSA